MNNIDMSVEIWKDIRGYKGIYQASNWGRIGSWYNNHGNKRNERKILIPGKRNKYGHSFVWLCSEGRRQRYQVHRLILETFIGPCPPGMVCRHLDGDPTNNRLDNLCWGTIADNARDKVIHGTSKVNRGQTNGMSKLNDWKVRIMKKLFEIPDMTDKEIAEIFDIGKRTVNSIRNNKRWKHI